MVDCPAVAAASADAQPKSLRFDGGERRRREKRRTGAAELRMKDRRGDRSAVQCSDAAGGKSRVESSTGDDGRWMLHSTEDRLVSSPRRKAGDGGRLSGGAGKAEAGTRGQRRQAEEGARRAETTTTRWAGERGQTRDVLAGTGVGGGATIEDEITTHSRAGIIIVER